MTPALPRPLPTLLLGACLTVLGSCGPATAPASDPAGAEAAATPEASERRVAEAIARVRESAVALEYAAADGPSGTRRMATGVVVSDRGDVLSVRIDPPPDSAPIVARDASGRRHPARWVASDPETGLTLLRIDPKVADPAQPSSRSPRLGSPVLIIGNPFGLGHSVSRGQVAGLDRRLELRPRPLGGLIQIDAALHPGDSGALVANLRGEWLGVVRSGLTVPDGGHAPDHDLGFAIPARDALWVAEQLRTRRRVERAYLGVRLNLGGVGDPPGAVLDSVLDDSPAARAGLRPGDRIVALDGHAIEASGDLTDRLDHTLAEAEVGVEYLRDTRRGRVTLRTARRPPFAPAPSNPGAEARGVGDRLEYLERRVRELEKRLHHGDTEGTEKKDGEEVRE